MSRSSPERIAHNARSSADSHVLWQINELGGMRSEWRRQNGLDLNRELFDVRQCRDVGLAE